MASNAAQAAELTQEQRLEVVGLYRKCRLGALPGGTFPIDALQHVRGVLSRWCVLGVLDGDQAEAKLRARQCSYSLVLQQSPAVRRVHRVILNRRIRAA